jgi:hypothetical protein
MIIVINLVCPNNHPVEGWPVEWKHEAEPPESWFDYQGRLFMRLMKKHPPRPCAFCGATFNPNSNDKTHLAKWNICASELKAKTMREAHAALKICAQMYTVEE